MLSQASVCPQSASWLLAHPCYGTVGTHATGMLSCFKYIQRVYLSGSFVLIMTKIPLGLIRTVFFCLALKKSRTFGFFSYHLQLN